MEMKTLFCPNCGKKLEVEDELEKCSCKYCGKEIMLKEQKGAIYAADVRKKQIESQERLQEMRDAQERYKMEFKQKNEKKTMIMVFSLFGAIGAICLILILFGNASAKRQDNELQSIVKQIMTDIENEDFAAAYIKANSLYWDDSWTSEGEDKWDATRNEIIKQIQKAEKEAAGLSIDD